MDCPGATEPSATEKRTIWSGSGVGYPSGAKLPPPEGAKFTQAKSPGRLTDEEGVNLAFMEGTGTPATVRAWLRPQ